MRIGYYSKIVYGGFENGKRVEHARSAEMMLPVWLIANKLPVHVVANLMKATIIVSSFAAFLGIL